MKTLKFNLWNFAVSVLLSATFAMTPPYSARAGEKENVQVTTITLELKCDKDGRVDQTDLAAKLPSDLPAEAKAKIAEALAKMPTKPGDTIVMAPEDCQPYGALVQEALRKAKVATIAAAASPVKDYGSPDGPQQALIGAGVIYLILAIIAIALFAATLYIIYLWARYFIRPPVVPPTPPPPPIVPPPTGTNSPSATNSPPQKTYSGTSSGAMVLSAGWAIASGGETAPGCKLLSSTNLLSSWNTKAAFRFSNVAAGEKNGTNYCSGTLTMTVSGQSKDIPVTIPLSTDENGSWILVGVSIVDTNPAPFGFLRIAPAD